MATLSIIEARKIFLDILFETSRGGDVKITRRGKVVFESGSSDRYPLRRGERLSVKVESFLRSIRNNGTRGDADSIAQARARAADRRF